jgi:hypothetical protein
MSKDRKKKLENERDKVIGRKTYRDLTERKINLA